MSEFRNPAELDPLLGELHTEQNAIEENLREQFLANHLFHHHHLAAAFGGEGRHPTSAEDLITLERAFMLEKRGKNMGERFEMALSPTYFDKIHVVELGLTEKPSDDGEIDGLKHDWADLRQWLVDDRKWMNGERNELIENEMSREESGRYLEYRRSHVAPRRTVVIRTRPLLEAHDNRAQLGIAKRMVFSMPEKLLKLSIETSEEKFKKETGSAPNAEQRKAGVMLYIENLLSTQHKDIDSIRTSYYLMSERIDEE